jgi:hypothetical protein
MRAIVILLIFCFGCSTEEPGWKVSGVPSDAVQAALDGWCLKGSRCDFINPFADNEMR